MLSVRARMASVMSLTRARHHVGGASSRTGLALLAALLVVVFQWQAGNFTTYNNFLAILLNSSSVLIAAIAAARLLAAGAIDLSIGGTYAVASVASALVARDTGSAILAVAAALAVGGVLGAVNGLLVRVLNISPIIVTLGLLFIYRGLALVVTDARSVSGLPASFVAIGRSRVLGVPMPVVVALGAFVLGSLALTRTVGGLRSYAIGGNRLAARFAGIQVDRHRMLLFVYLGVSVGLVALLSTARLGSGSPSTGTDFEIDVLTAVILGGVAFDGGAGRPVGVFVGVVTISILNAGMIFVGLENFYQQIAKGLVLLLALGADQFLGARRPRAPTGARRASTRTVPLARRTGRPADDRAGTGDVVMAAEHLAKSYGSVVAVSDVSLEARAGEVLCLVGDNGAGKSTAIKMLSGVIAPDRGTVRLDGEDRRFGGPADARAAGIETVYQDLALCPNLGAAYNLVLGREPRRLPGLPLGSLAPLDRHKAVEEAEGRLRELDIDLDDYLRPVDALSGGQRQAVAISRVVRDGVRVVILDEPTAALGVSQTDSVLRLARRLASRGAAVIIVTHDVEAVLAVSDRVVVLNLGQVIFSGTTRTLSDRDLVHLMAGLPIIEEATDGVIEEATEEPVHDLA